MLMPQRLNRQSTDPSLLGVAGTPENKESLNTAESYGMERDHTVIELEVPVRVFIMVAEVRGSY